MAREKGEKSEKPGLRFIFLLHQDFEVCSEKLLAELEDRNIIFLELVSTGNIKFDRKRMEDLVNLVLASPETLTSEMQERQDTYIEKFASSSEFAPQLVAHLARSGKHMFLVDIDDDNPDFHLVGQSLELLDIFIKSYKAGDITGAERLHREYVSTRARLHQVRENEVKSQIEKLMSVLQNEMDMVKAAVIQGIVHQPTVGLLDEKIYDLETVVFTDDLTLESRLWLDKRMGIEPTNVEYRRALLVSILLENFDLKHGFDAGVDRKLTLLVRSLSDNQVDLAFDQFEMTYRQNLSRITNRRRLSAEDKVVYAPAAFSLTIDQLLKTVTRWSEDRAR